MTKPTGVLMVGSVPGASPQEVFTRLATALPGRLEAIPDGETGERWNYIGWQLQRFPRVARRNELGGIPLSESGSGLPTFTLADIEPTAYDEVALSSYTEFKRLRQEHIIPENVRFQIGLPSPYSVVVGHVKTELANAIEPLYEQRLAESIDHIFTAIPHDDLVIQWDLCFEMTALEFDQGRPLDKRHQAYFPSPSGLLQGLVDRVVRLCDRIPEDVKLAFHLCYGDLNHQHFIEPHDALLLVKLANALLARETLGPRTEWIHLPVPKERTDPGYFAPLAGLKLDSSASKPPRIYLGVVHANDEAGTKKRIDTAQASVPFPFGVATECGLGRTPPEEIDSILRICKKVTAEPVRENL
ncbi:Uu.00g073240.m01.CDS01 [Anthostomella pinea]|uniref:Uu.00g073240.m01.CDS01 n=1 Tax=Anthostomella pinea TaxID=933095 RepID=A0AAI8VW03_9PEZI|nr:Uu.00g073240.m01.CDS01 [Anthostomella pinea]